MSFTQIHLPRMHRAISAGAEPKLPGDNENKATLQRLNAKVSIVSAFRLQTLPVFPSGTFVA
jgi:hypothetical protein